MKIQTYTDSAAFLKRVQPFLEAQEAVNSLVLGIAIRVYETPDWFELPPYLATVEDSGGQLLLVAVQTPPQNILLSGADTIPQPAMDLLVQNLRDSGTQLRGVNAVNQLGLQFAESWSRACGQLYRAQMRERLYEVHEVVPPQNPPPGFFRLARMEDVELLTMWHNAFFRESLHEDPPSKSREQMERRIQAGNTFVWDDGRPVSMAVRSRLTPHSASISGVYTPPDLRGRGYASACVAALSQYILDSGKQFCTLFTDLDFPTSNAIYQRIGYRPVCDFIVYRFV